MVGQPEDGYQLIKNVTECIPNALKKADEITDMELNSILFPLRGTGTIQMNAQEMAAKLVDAAVCYMEENPDAKSIRHIFLPILSRTAKFAGTHLSMIRELIKGRSGNPSILEQTHPALAGCVL